MTLAWVVGSSGLLGSALCRQLDIRSAGKRYLPTLQMRWREELGLPDQLAQLVADFAEQARSHQSWELFWAAGIGTMGSAAADLALETRTLSLLLQLIAAQPVLMDRPGYVALASSAGAIYAGSTDDIVTELSATAATTHYARAKLEQEEKLWAFADQHQSVVVLLARISTIYGAGRVTSKRQGLLAHMARAIVRHQPIQIYVPFDTIRDYIAVDDAAAIMIKALRTPGLATRVNIKIVASEVPLTIAEIVSTFKRIARRRPLIATAASPLGSSYSRRIQFRSTVMLECKLLPRVPLLIGVAHLITAELQMFTKPNTPENRS